MDPCRGPGDLRGATAEVERLKAELADEVLSNLLRDSGDGAGDDQADSGSSALEREHELSSARGPELSGAEPLDEVAATAPPGVLER